MWEFSLRSGVSPSCHKKYPIIVLDGLKRYLWIGRLWRSNHERCTIQEIQDFYFSLTDLGR
jgi:hypothetical protein